VTDETRRPVSRTIRSVSPTDLPGDGVSAMTAADVLASIDNRLSRATQDFRVLPTGFSPLDEVIGGGLRGGDLFLLAGGQGTGKTTLAFQMARNVAVAGVAACLYLSFEHDEINLLTRLLALESAQPEAHGDQGLKFRDAQHLFVAASRRGVETVAALATADPRLTETLRRIDRYQERLMMLRASTRTMTVDAIGALLGRIQEKLDKPIVLFVDYLQKVPAEREFLNEGDRVTWVTEALNELSLQHRVSIVAIAALDQEGLRAKRLHVHHLWGGASLAYEADIILMLAEKADAIAKVYYEFSPQKVQTFREWVVASLAKNRSGQNLIDMEFRKRFMFSCFDPNGGFVAEKLADERTYQ